MKPVPVQYSFPFFSQFIIIVKSIPQGRIINVKTTCIALRLQGMWYELLIKTNWYTMTF
jgi:hypothetical protein